MQCHFPHQWPCCEFICDLILTSEAWGEVDWKLLWGFLTVRRKRQEKGGLSFPPNSYMDFCCDTWNCYIYLVTSLRKKLPLNIARKRNGKNLGPCFVEPPVNQAFIVGCLPQCSNLLLTLVWVCVSELAAKASSLLLRKCQFTMRLTMMWKIKMVDFDIFQDGATGHDQIYLWTKIQV